MKIIKSYYAANNAIIDTEFSDPARQKRVSYMAPPVLEARQPRDPIEHNVDLAIAEISSQCSVSDDEARAAVVEYLGKLA